MKAVAAFILLALPAAFAQGNNAACNTALVAANAGIEAACSVGLTRPTDPASAPRYFSGFITNLCTVPSCYNSPVTYASNIASVCPAGYTLTVGTGTTATTQRADEYAQAKTRSQAEVDASPECIKSSNGTYCMADIFTSILSVGASTSPDALKSVFCTDCMRRIVTAAETTAASSASYSLGDISELKTQVTQICGAGFLTASSPSSPSASTTTVAAGGATATPTGRSAGTRIGAGFSAVVGVVIAAVMVFA